MHIIPYQPSHYEQWNEFIQNSENGNFLFHRNYMEYHQDRFKDASVLLLDEKERLKAIFPANIHQNTLYSHQGLTYGGIILKDRNHIQEIIRYFYHITEYYLQNGIESIIYKPVPNYIAKSPCDAEHFIMKIIRAELTRVDTSFVIHLQEPIRLQERRKRCIKKAEKLNIDIQIGNDFSAFWKKVLEPNLWERYQAKPVHSLQEIERLHQRFPHQILQANAYLNKEIVAGVTLFDFSHTIHCQYISSTNEGRDTGAIDLLFYYLIQHFQQSKKFFSMGTSNNNGNDLNLGVSEYKESFDTKIYAHFHYMIHTSSIHILKKYL